MAVVQGVTTDTPPLICLSSDTKPSGLQAGHLAYETDTGAWYIYNGSAWVAYSAPVAQDGWRLATKTVTFTGAAGAGAQGTINMFTVAGTVAYRLVLVQCVTNITTTGGTVALGVAGATDVVMAAKDHSGATAGQVYDFDGGAWATVAPAGNYSLNPGIVSTSTIIATVATADITAGSARYVLEWFPLVAGSTLVAA